MKYDLERLIEEARKTKMSEAEQELQRRSFAYGNVAMSNPRVTRRMVDDAAERMKELVTKDIPPCSDAV